MNEKEKNLKCFKNVEAMNKKVNLEGTLATEGWKIMGMERDSAKQKAEATKDKITWNRISHIKI